MVNVAIAGASGYTGSELLRLLLRHPAVQVTALAAGERAGESLAKVLPHLRGACVLELERADWDALAEAADVVFLALPHGHSVEAARSLLERGRRVIDLGADFRLRDVAAYQTWYGLEHQAPELLREAVYGLPEAFGAEIRQARLVANPGCYPTAAALALLPLLDLAQDGREIVVDAKSGVSGAGRKPGLGTTFGEVNENVRAYGVLTHRHTPEIAQTLAILGAPRTVVFAPHLIPMTRGLLATCYVALDEELSQEAALERYRSRYRDCPFVRVLDDGSLPETKAVAGSNFCDVTVRVHPSGRLAIAIAAIDNLVKGAAGQAVHNLNLMLGLAQTTGLEVLPLFP